MAANTSRSLQVSSEKLSLIEKALLQFSSKRDLAAQLEMSPNTITNFFKGRKVQRRQFHKICKKLKVDWREVAGIAAASEEDNSQPEAESQTPASTQTRSVPHNIPPFGKAEDGGYRFHPLIREFFALKRGEYPEAEEWQQEFVASMVAVAREVPDVPILEEIQTLEPLIPHLVEVAERWIGEVADEDLILPFVGLGRFYEGQGFYSLAEPWYETCPDVVRDQLGENHPNVATSFGNLAELYRSQGQYEEAEPLLQNALELRRNLLGEEHPHVATSFGNLAGLYKSQGRYEEAEPLYIQALALRRNLLGENHLHVAISLNNLAELYRSQGQYEDAEPLYIQALELTRNLLGEEHPHVATSFGNLAELYRSQGRYEEAEPIYIQALALRRNLLGENHPDVAQSLNNLAFLYKYQEKYAEAEPLYIQALEICEQRLGLVHPNTMACRSNYARCLRESSAVANPPNLPENASVEEIVAHWQQMLEDAGEDE